MRTLALAVTLLVSGCCWIAPDWAETPEPPKTKTCYDVPIAIECPR